jgi:hypothetical protein
MSVSILTAGMPFGNTRIQFCGVSVVGTSIVAMLRRGSTTRAVNAEGLDLTAFSAKQMRRAWHQASRGRNLRQSKIRKLVSRPGTAA